MFVDHIIGGCGPFHCWLWSFSLMVVDHIINRCAPYH